jgi:hypothetical protein
MPMITQKNYQPTSGTGLSENRFEYANMLHSPNSIDLVPLVQVIIHSIDDDSYYSLLLVRQRLSNITREAGIFISL